MTNEEFEELLEKQPFGNKQLPKGVLGSAKDALIPRMPIDPSRFFAALEELFSDYIDENVSFASVKAPYILASEEALVAIIGVLHALARSETSSLQIDFVWDEYVFTLFFYEKSTGKHVDADFSRLPLAWLQAVRSVVERTGMTISLPDEAELMLSIPFYHAATEISYTASHERLRMFLERMVNDLYFLAEQ